MQLINQLFSIYYQTLDAEGLIMEWMLYILLTVTLLKWLVDGCKKLAGRAYLGRRYYRKQGLIYFTLGMVSFFLLCSCRSVLPLLCFRIDLAFVALTWLIGGYYIFCFLRSVYP